MTHGDLVISRHPDQHYRTLFNRKTGVFVRKEDKGYKEPFWSQDGPELLDVAITNYCERGCAFCYRQSNKDGIHMSIEDISNIVRQAQEIGVLQIALGGGNPNQHPQFCEILQLIRLHGIVPSYTTNGVGLSDEVLIATAQYCGAMAVSLYPPYDEHYEALLYRINRFGIRCNLHMILKSDTIDTAIDWLQSPPAFMRYVNAIIFLNYKPINMAYPNRPIEKDKLRHFFQTTANCRAVKIGFDSCSISGIVQYMHVPNFLIESCEAARFSAFISEDMKMYPCSFMVETEQYGDLRKKSMYEVWKTSDAFVNFRNQLSQKSCAQCAFQATCNGGCHFMPHINFCEKG